MFKISPLNFFYHVPLMGVTLSNLLHIFFNSILLTQKIYYTIYKTGTGKTAREQLMVDQLCYLCRTSP